MIKKTYLAWIFWILAAIFYFYEFLLQVFPNVITHEIMRDFSTNATQLGTLVAIYFYTYACMQIPVGMLIDRFGPRRTLFTAALFCGIGSIFFAIAKTFLLTELARFFIGLGSAYSAIGCMNIAAHWFPRNRFALILGLSLTVGMSGAIIGQAPVSMLVNAFGYRQASWIFAYIGITISVLMLLILRDRPRDENAPIINARLLFQGFIKILKNKATWCTALYGGLMYTPTMIFGGLWGVPFLSTKYHLSTTLAALIISFIYIGWVIGCPVFGFLSDHMGKRKPLMLLSNIAALLIILLILFYPYAIIPDAAASSLFSKIINYAPLAFAFFLFGVASSGFPLCFALAKELHSKDYVSVTMGFINTINMLGAALVPPIIGMILDSKWQGTMDNGARIYSVPAFELGLSTLIIALILSVFFLYFVPETHCKNLECK